MSQYVLPITLPPVFTEDNFVVSGCNQEAHEWILHWPNWPAHAFILYGSSGSGKSHLGQIWVKRSGAIVLPGVPGNPINSNVLIEHMEKIGDEHALLHLLNFSKENGHYVLLTSSIPPKQLPFGLPDLTSRLLALPCAYIAPPDDEVLAAALRKQFADRQLKIEEEVIAYLVARIERSFTHIREIVEKLDTESMSEQKNLTIPFVKRVLNY
jgi:chromosomal replication initiation ATPase DnaA